MDFDQHSGAAIDDYASACQEVEILLFTRLAELVMLREYGGGAVELLGRLATPKLFAAFKLLVAAGIDLWIPRFRVRRVIVTGSVDEVRAGRFGFRVEVDWRPRAHLGDETVEAVRSLDVDFASGRVTA